MCIIGLIPATDYYAYLFRSRFSLILSFSILYRCKEWASKVSSLLVHNIITIKSVDSISRDGKDYPYINVSIFNTFWVQSSIHNSSVHRSVAQINVSQRYHLLSTGIGWYELGWSGIACSGRPIRICPGVNILIPSSSLWGQVPGT